MILEPFILSVIREGQNGALALNALTAVCLRLHDIQKDDELRPTRNSSARRSFEYCLETYNPSCATKEDEEVAGCVASIAARC